MHTSSPSTTSPPTAIASRARRSRRSTSPTRSRGGSTRTAPTTSRTRSRPAGCPAYPTYEVKTFEGTSLNKSINLVNATLTSDNTVYAQLAADLGENTITEMAYKMGVKTHLSSYPAEALGGLTLGRYAAGNGRRLRDARRRRLAQLADRDHEGRVPRRPRRLAAGARPTARRCSPKGSPPRRRDPARERRERHRDALGDRLPDRRQDGHDQRTGRRLARRLHAPLRDGRVDGLSEQARLDDRRPRRAPAGRLPARGNLARLHGGVTEGQPCIRIPRSPRNRSPTSRSSGTSRAPGAPTQGSEYSRGRNARHGQTKKPAKRSSSRLQRPRQGSQRRRRKRGSTRPR